MSKKHTFQDSIDELRRHNLRNRARPFRSRAEQIEDLELSFQLSRKILELQKITAEVQGSKIEEELGELFEVEKAFETVIDFLQPDEKL